MSTVHAPSSAATEALAERLFEATIDTLEIASVHIGGRLGLYRALAEAATRRRGSSRRARAPMSATSGNGSSSRPWPGS